MDDTKVAYVCNSDFVGIGNKIIVLIGDMRVAKDHYKKDFYLYWNKLIFEFNELFDTNIKILHHKPINQSKPTKTAIKMDSILKAKYPPNEYPNDKYIFYWLHDDTKIRGRVASLPLLDTDRQLLNTNLEYYPLDYKSISKHIIDLYLPYFKLLKPALDIQKIVDVYSEKFTEHTVSVHVRRGDFLNYAKRSNNTDDKYFKEMNSMIKANSQTTFFVSSDEPETEQLFREKFGDKIFLYPHTYDKTQYDEKTALICILLLAKNNRMLLSRYSTFSYVAWWFGDCKAVVKVL